MSVRILDAPGPLTCRNHELQRRLRLAASAANLQQNLASELKYPSGPASYMHAAARAWLASTSCKHRSKSLVSIASNGSEWPVGRLAAARRIGGLPLREPVTLDRSPVLSGRDQASPTPSITNLAPASGPGCFGCFCSETTAIAPPRSRILRRPSVLPERTSNTNIMAILSLQMQHQTKPTGRSCAGSVLIPDAGLENRAFCFALNVREW